MIRLLTISSDEFLPLAAITSPTKRDYARKWGYEFVQGRHVDVSRASWERAEQWLSNLRECDVLFFTGCDAMITNHSLPLQERFDLEAADFIFAADGNGLQCDSWIMMSNERTVAYLEELRKYEGRENNEQDALSVILSGSKDYSSFCGGFGQFTQGGFPMNDEERDRLQLALNQSRVKVKIVSQRELNAYPHDLYGGSNEMPWSWQPGDFVCHAPGHSLKTRIEYLPTLLG
jgi:hypothetical protein